MRVVTYKKVNSIKFPSFILPSNNITKEDGLVFVNGRIIDDTNMPNDTLGMRRLISPFSAQMYPLKRAAFELLAILKNTGKTTYIDYTGDIFTYVKMKWVKLRCIPIERSYKRGNYTILKLEGINNVFEVPRPPLLEQNYARVLYLNNHPWMLYDYKIDPEKTTKRLI